MEEEDGMVEEGGVGGVEWDEGGVVWGDEVVVDWVEGGVEEEGEEYER